MQASSPSPAHGHGHAHGHAHAHDSADVVRRHADLQPRLGLVLGSGFGAVARAVRDAVVIEGKAVPGFVLPTVPGHPGKLILGRLGEETVAVLAGRPHFYEGHDLATVTFPIRVLAALGVRTVLLTNAAGGIRPDLAPGDFVALTDHLNLIGDNPLRGPGGSERFVDLSEVYGPRPRKWLHEAAAQTPVALKEGVYAAVAGPSYETPAEVRALARLGADLVGMSTVPEAIVARQCGLSVAGLSCVTNRAAGLGGAISHDEVLAIGRRVADTATPFLTHFASAHARAS